MRKITCIAVLLLAAFQGKSQTLFTESFDGTPGWTIAHVSGSSTSAGWSFVTSGVNPTCSPLSGTGMAMFNSYDAENGNVYSLTSPAIAFGGQFYKAGFNVYRDSGYGSSDDNIRVYYNSTASMAGATLLTTVNRSLSLSPVETSEGWHHYDAYLPNGVSGNGYIIMLGSSGYGNNMFLDDISVEQVNAVNDSEITALNLNSILTVGTNTISGAFRNISSTPITSIDINWQITGDVAHTQSLSGLNIAPGASYTFTHADQWTPTTGQYTLTVWTSNTNGGDTNSDNDIIERTIYVVNEIYPKTVVYEEATGTWCGWCVRGHIGLKDMAHYHDDGSWIGIAVHNNDPMVLSAYDTAIGNFISGYPSGTMDRVTGEVDPGTASIEAGYQAELARIPLGKVEIANQTWDPVTRQITFDGQAIFALDINNANYNLSAVIVENGVHGTTPTWRQRNYYAGGTITDWEGINWGAYPAYIPAATMIYNHVGRALLGGFTGVNGSVPTAVSASNPYSYTFTHTLPATQDENNIELVVMLLDKTTGQIVNAKEVSLDTTLGIATYNKNKFGIFPNPSTGVLYIATATNVAVDIVDLVGKTVYHASEIANNQAINLSGLQKGVYLAKISDGTNTSTQKIILK